MTRESELKKLAERYDIPDDALGQLEFLMTQELKTENKALRQDAERYRFIRNRAHEDNLHAIIMYRNRAANTQCIVGGQQADAVIDRLMSDVNG